MLFPTLRGKRFGYINLNEEAKRWLLLHPQNEKNPLLDPDTCYEMVQHAHARLGIDYSYGGWMEPRPDLWRGSYLDASQMYLHLGLDFNVPAGTPVAVDHSCTVVSVETDLSSGGWGTYVIVEHIQTSDIILFAHLDDQADCKAGDILSPGQVFGRVGTAQKNGQWFPHLHVQCIDPDFFKGLTPLKRELLDGYGSEEDLGNLARLFKDPLNLISLHS